MFYKIKRPIGHNIVCVGYALKDLETGKRLTKWQNVAVECETCNEVIINEDNPQK